MSKFLIAAMMSTALVGTAVAQSSTEPSTSSPPAATSPSTINKSDRMAAPSTNAVGEWRSSKLVGLNVYNDNNEKLGAINDLILDKEGNVANVVIGVGGFLGMGEHNISVSFDRLRWVDEPVRTTTSDARPSGAAGTTGSGMGTMGSGSSSGTVGSATTTSGKTWHPDHAVLSGATKDQLKEMPAFQY